MSEQAPDLLYGMPAIAKHLGLKTAQARHLSDKELLTTFKIGKLVCARRSTLNAWLVEQEAASRMPAVRKRRAAR
jgi:hypothetical protein